MTNRTPLEARAPWVEIATTPDDWKKADPQLLETMLGQLHLIRAFEEVVLELASEGLVHGPAHSSIGQEGGAVLVAPLQVVDVDDQRTPVAHPRQQFAQVGFGFGPLFDGAVLAASRIEERGPAVAGANLRGDQLDGVPGVRMPGDRLRQDQQRRQSAGQARGRQTVPVSTDPQRRRARCR